MRTVYLGTSEFAAGVLRALAQSAHRPVLVVTRPDRPRGRGRRIASPPVAMAARELGIELDQPESVGDPAVRARVAAARPDVVVVCAFGALIREPLLSDHELLNVHPSLLPRWRGAAPIERAIMSGDTRTGVSIMRLTAGLDSGPVCDQAEIPIGPRDTYGTVTARLQGLGVQRLLATLEHPRPCHAQDDALATYAEKLSAEDRVLDPLRPASELELGVRALNPHIGAVVIAGGERLGVWEARALATPGPPVGVVSFGGPRPVLGCAQGSLELVVVQPAGRRAMAGADFLRGRRG